MISQWDILARLGAAALLGSLIGFERERLAWAAGVRTHMLVAVGSCLFMIVSAYGFEHARLNDHVMLDPSRIAAQVVSGIGFLGAGSILLRGHTVRGLTTAASIWSVAALGLACGGGLYFAAGATTVIILIILAGMKPLEELYRVRLQTATLTLIAHPDTLTPDMLPKIMGLRGSQVRRVIVQHAADADKLTIRLVHVSRGAIDGAVAALGAHPDVTEAMIANQQ
jgi:putative Mg2+ transporter-C (MgtC) family protein